MENNTLLSVELMGVALIREVIMEELREELPDRGPPPALQLTTQLLSEVQQQLVTQMGRMVRIVGDRQRDDPEFQDLVDGMFNTAGSMLLFRQLLFRQLFNNLFEDGEITWERITVLFYVAGRMAVKVMKERNPDLVMEIFKLTVDYFKTKLLVWVHSHGGWIISLSVLCGYVQTVTPMSPHTTRHLLIFIAGLAFGSIITWKLARGS